MTDEAKRLADEIQQCLEKYRATKRHGMRALNGGGERTQGVSAPTLRLVKTDAEES